MRNIKKLSVGLLTAGLLLTGCAEKEKVEEREPALNIETDKEYVAELEKNEGILDASYSIVEDMGVATLVLSVDETVTAEQAAQMAKEREAEVLEEYPDYLPVVTVMQGEKELYSTLTAEVQTELVPTQEPKEEAPKEAQETETGKETQ